MRKATPELAPDARNQQSDSTRPDKRPDRRADRYPTRKTSANADPERTAFARRVNPGQLPGPQRVYTLECRTREQWPRPPERDLP